MHDSQVIDVEVTPGQYEALLRLTAPHDAQQEHLVQLRSALENAVWATRRNRHILPGMNIKMIRGAEFVLGVNALKNSQAATLHLNRFRRTYHKYLEINPRSGRFTLAWLRNSGSNDWVEDPHTYTAPGAEIKRRELYESGAADVEIRPV
ncbi:hypothetical protein [Streptomyces sp. NPDC015350]|uniref:hypothetical protein n=1 Tax=Streptomyces sp. NPDC015350 TaxID=3364955 RepID=UPI0037026132